MGLKGLGPPTPAYVCTYGWGAIVIIIIVIVIVIVIVLFWFVLVCFVLVCFVQFCFLFSSVQFCPVLFFVLPASGQPGEFLAGNSGCVRGSPAAPSQPRQVRFLQLSNTAALPQRSTDR